MFTIQYFNIAMEDAFVDGLPSEIGDFPRDVVLPEGTYFSCWFISRISVDENILCMTQLILLLSPRMAPVFFHSKNEQVQLIYYREGVAFRSYEQLRWLWLTISSSIKGWYSLVYLYIYKYIAGDLI